jgi:hypothetical protein
LDPKDHPGEHSCSKNYGYIPSNKNYSYLNLITPIEKKITANPSKTPAAGRMSINPPPRRTSVSNPCIAQVVGNILTMFCIGLLTKFA